jgi:hypothetical protein
VQQVAVDAFGNALGGSLAASSISTPVSQGDAPGDFIDKNMPAWQQPQANYDSIVNAFSQRQAGDGASGVLVADARDALRLSSPTTSDDDEYYANIIHALQTRDAARQTERANYRAGEAKASAALYASGAGDVRDFSPAFSDGEIDAMRQANLARSQALAGETQAALGASTYQTGIYSNDTDSIDYYRQLDGRVVVQIAGVGVPTEPESGVAQVIGGMSERLNALVEDAQDRYVQAGAASGGWNSALNAAGYVASEFFPRSVGQAAFEAVGGPLIGRAVGAGVAQLNRLPAVGNTLPQLGRSVTSWFRGGAAPPSSITPSAWAKLRATDTSSMTRAEKGVLGEARASLAYQRAGYEQLPSRLASNNGFDGVFVKKAPDGTVVDIIINESKFSSTGRPSFANTNMGKQMSPGWINENIQKMMNRFDDPGVMEAGFFLDVNRSLVRTKANVLDPLGNNRWNVLQLSK